ncbi:nitroreductase/quinone reductase family protein [Mycolicibacterium houstonense]|uniref:nitroreductase/quinone reductase family protein n=1 Tax=Mycolicibacterium houstonense TaxID=146021 RepID=UPI0008357B7A|nr:nitroreductase/quinone reductase family protein [Mycolicibacterium houstonense]
MAYLKPPWFVRKVFNRIAMATGVGHSETLTVTRRGSKQPQQIPVVVPVVDGVKYLVSTRGESDWVRNVRAEPKVRLGSVDYVAAEIPVPQRAPVIAAYRPLAGKVVDGYFRELPDDADHPVFALTPAT